MRDLFDNWIYRTAPDNQYRFTLGEKGKKMLACIGVNPSTATPEKLDPTLRKVRTFSKNMGYDGWIMFNLSPQRATDPNGLHDQLAKWWNERNMFHIQSTLEQYKIDHLWAAWGTLIEKRQYLIESLQGIACIAEPHKNKWLTVGGLTQKGHPRHPLYLPYKSKVQIFDINGYLKNIKAAVIK